MTKKLCKVELKRCLKYLSVCRNPHTIKEILRHSKDNVIKGICNCALNAERGDVTFSKSQKQKLAKHRAASHHLTLRTVPLKTKRTLIQKGGAAWLPILLSTVLSTIGPAIIGAITGKKDEQA